MYDNILYADIFLSGMLVMTRARGRSAKFSAAQQHLWRRPRLTWWECGTCSTRWRWKTNSSDYCWVCCIFITFISFCVVVFNFIVISQLIIIGLSFIVSSVLWWSLLDNIVYILSILSVLAVKWILQTFYSIAPSSSIVVLIMILQFNNGDLPADLRNKVLFTYITSLLR